MQPGNYDHLTQMFMYPTVRERAVQYQEEARHSELVALSKQAQKEHPVARYTFQQKLGRTLIRLGVQLSGEPSLLIKEL